MKLMPRHRPPREVWQILRRQIWLRDGGLCRGPYCQHNDPLPLDQVQIDHICSGKLAGNGLKNLRTLCRRCHVLRLDFRHRGMIAAALRDGLIPANWRKFMWDDGSHYPSEETIVELRAWIAAQEVGKTIGK